MRTEVFQSIRITGDNVAKCCQYSDAPERLKDIIATLKIEIRFDGEKLYFAEDKEPRICATIRISRTGYRQPIEFSYGFSINDTQRINGKAFRHLEIGAPIRREMHKAKEEFFDGILYSVLCSCRSEYHCPKSFADFCGEYGYDTDSRRAYDMHRECLEQSAKLEYIFSSEEVEALPS